MNTLTEERDPMMTRIAVLPAPVKLLDEQTMTLEQVEQQGQYARQSLQPVAADAPGTCIDEREREGTREEAGKTESRASVPAGPDGYALYMGVLSGYHYNIDAESDEPANIQMLRQSKAKVNAAGIVSGGHDGCAAFAGLDNTAFTIMVDNASAVKAYAKSQLGSEYEEALADKVVGYASEAKKSKVFDEHTESALEEVLGDEADNGIEKLVGKHEGRTLVRNKVRGHTVNQTFLHKLTKSETGQAEDSFVMDDWYADDIENAMAEGPDAATQGKLMRHAREILLAAIANAVPNEELHQINLS